MLKLTLDHNCIISLEVEDENAGAVRELISLHHADRIMVYVGSISASENVRGADAPSVAAFTERLHRLGIETLPQVMPVARLGMSYLGFAVLGGDDALEDRIVSVIHPSHRDYMQFAAEKDVDPSGPMHPKWRNRACDIDGIVAHIRNGHDVFVTSDRHFLDHRVELGELGAGAVLTPREALKRAKDI